MLMESLVGFDIGSFLSSDNGLGMVVGCGLDLNFESLNRMWLDGVSWEVMI